MFLAKTSVGFDYSYNCIYPNSHLLVVEFQAMENSLVNSPHVHQPAMETLEDSQIFFVAYAQVTLDFDQLQYFWYFVPP